MAYGDAVGPGYAEGTPTSRLAARDLGRTAVAGLVPQIQEITHEITGLGSLIKQVTTAGTRVRLNASSLLFRRASVTALRTNTDLVVVGDSNVVAAQGTQATPTMRGYALGPGEVYHFEFNDLTNVWLDSLVSGDGVTAVYFT